MTKISNVLNAFSTFKMAGRTLHFNVHLYQALFKMDNVTVCKNLSNHIVKPGSDINFLIGAPTGDQV